MVQLWVNLRAKDKSAKAGYQTLLKAQIPNVALPDDAGTVRVIAGEYGGLVMNTWLKGLPNSSRE
jgi:redox-sensitive bicupin YhaK (pirin superfamily)